MTVATRPFTSAYRIDPTYFSISEQPGSNNPVDETIASLFACKEHVLKPGVYASNIWKVLSLTQDIITHLEQENQSHYGWLSAIASIRQRTFGNIGQLQEYKAALQERLKAADASLEASMKLLFTQENPNLSFLAINFYTASPALRKSELFVRAQAIFNDRFASALFERSLDQELFEYAKELDPYHEWIHRLANLNPDPALINQVMRHVTEDHYTQDSLTDSEALLFLFKRTYHLVDFHLRTVDKTSVFKLTSQLVRAASQIQQKKTPTLTWQEIMQTYSLALFTDFIFQTADVGLKNRTLLPVIESGLTYLISKESDFDWMTCLMEHPPTDTFTVDIAQILDSRTFSSSDTSKTHRILQRYWQIAAVPEEIRKLPRFQMLRLAYFIETVLCQEYITIPREYPCYPHFDKHNPLLQNHRSPPLGTSIEQDLTTGHVTLLLRRKGSRFEGDEGLVKKPRLAIHLHANRNEKAEVICRTANRSLTTTSTIEPVPADEKEACDLRQEGALQQSLRGQRGIWPLYNALEYTTMKNGQRICKVSLKSMLADCKVSRYTRPLPPRSSDPEELQSYQEALSQYNTRMKETPLSQLLKMFLDLAHGLNHLHQNNRYHLDIKSRNAFIKLNANKEIEMAGWSDFGHSNPNSRDYLGSIAVGTYGTIVYTAPELMGKTAFAGDHKALDIWAFGCMMFEVIKRNRPSWISDVLELMPLFEPNFTSSRIASVKALAMRDIEDPLTRLNPKSRNVDERLDYLILSMLRFDPKQRFTMTRVIEELVAIGQLKYGPGQIV